MMRSSINLQSVHLHRGKRPVIEALNLTIDAADRVAILGPSGVGKSTLLQAIAGLAPIHSGNILIEGRTVAETRHSVTMMLQRPALLPWASVRENVLLGARLSGVYRRDPLTAQRRAFELLERVGLADRCDAKPAELSGGEQQRVALARALAPSPSILLLDEPFSALDPDTRSLLRKDVARLARDTGITLLLVTHDLADATALCRRIVRLGGKPARIESDRSLNEATDTTSLSGELATAA